MTSHPPKGAILLFNVLVMGVVAVSAAAVLARGSLEGVVGGAETLTAWNTRADIFGCIDEVIIQIQKENDFQATTLFTGSATCTVAIDSPTSGERHAVVSLSENGFTHQATVSLQLSPFSVTQITEP